MKSKIIFEDKKIIVRPNIIYCIFACFLLVIGAIGFAFTYYILVSDEKDIAIIAAVFSLVFVCCGMLILYEYGNTVVIDERGVSSYLLFKRFLPWEEIQDYGFSYEYASRNLIFAPEHIYTLYFAKNKLRDLGYGDKIFKGKTIRHKFSDSDVCEIAKKIRTFCKQYTSVRMNLRSVFLDRDEKPKRLKFNKNKTQLKIKPSKKYVFECIIGLIAVVMLVAAVCKFYVIDGKVTFSTDLIIIGSFIAATLALVLYAINGSFKSLEINKSGVQSRSIFGKRSLSWHEIQDYGVSCGGDGRSFAYILYFSNEIEQIKKNGGKKLKGKTVSIFFSPMEYDTFVGKALPFCEKYAYVDPYNADIKSYWI